MKKGVAIDVNDLEAQFLRSASTSKTKSPAFIVGDEFEDEEVIEFNDNDSGSVVDNVIEGIIESGNANIVSKHSPDKKAFTTKAVTGSIPITNKKTFSYASATGNGNGTESGSVGSLGKSSMTVEELEAQLVSGMVVSPKSPVSQLVGAGPPPGLPPGLSQSGHGRSVDTLTSTMLLPSSNNSNNTSMMSSIAPLPKNDANKEFMNRFERNLIMKIHTTQLTTETPLMDDFYYQALSKKKKSESGASGTAGPNGQLLYFPLPSAAERQKELQRRERRRKLREKERESRDGEVNTPAPVPNQKETEISAELVLGKVSHSTSRKPRQQLKVPTNLIVSESPADGHFSLHEKVIKGIEDVYSAIISIEDFYLSKEEQLESNSNASAVPESVSLETLVSQANETISRELNLNNSRENGSNHIFIHFLTIPKGRAIISRLLKVLSTEEKGKFLQNLVEYFDFMEIVRPETSLLVIDSFISQVLSPLVAFVGEADWSIVMESLRTLFAKRSFVWIALTKAGMVLLCILLSRLEILKGLENELSGAEAPVLGSNSETDSSVLAEKVYDSLEGHLLEFFSPSDPHRDFYAWQFLALLAMNVESDRKRAMILELRDKILVIVESEDERSVKNLNVFLNALGLDASQLK